MSRPRLLVVDNIDSFTFMLVDYLRHAGADVEVARNDVLTVGQAIEVGADGIVISPGPGAPEDAGISIALAAACASASRPLFGVCLGHQALALACGGSVMRTSPMHGKIAAIRHDGSGLFAGLPSPIAATRYHSLTVSTVPQTCVANAWSEDGVIMAMRHRDAPVHGVQFHPESIATDHGATLVRAFVDQCRKPT